MSKEKTAFLLYQTPVNPHCQKKKCTLNKNNNDKKKSHDLC